MYTRDSYDETRITFTLEGIDDEIEVYEDTGNPMSESTLEALDYYLNTLTKEQQEQILAVMEYVYPTYDRGIPELSKTLREVKRGLWTIDREHANTRDYAEDFLRDTMGNENYEMVSSYMDVESFADDHFSEYDNYYTTCYGVLYYLG